MEPRSPDLERVRPAPRTWHALSVDEAIGALESDRDAGLDTAESRRRLAELGPNALPEPRQRSLASIFIGQFKSPLIYLLFLAAGTAFLLGHRSDAIVIYVVVLLNAIIGTVQEGRAERSLAALRKLATHRVRVVREGLELVIDARELVPGDMVLLEAGDAITADGRVLESAALQVAEAALTGESAPVTKSNAPVAPDTPLADRADMVYAGTYVTGGRARTVVVATGLDAEVGRIAALAETAIVPKTPLAHRIEQFGRYIIVVAAAIFVLITAIGVLHGMTFGDIVMIGISQVVGMIPEGLPVAMTIALAVGVQRMVRRRAVVRRLAAVETLGSTTIICTDKTGTLTRNEMTVVALLVPPDRELVVGGNGNEPKGTLDGAARDHAAARELLEAVVLCNDAQLQPVEGKLTWKPLGDPTEVALLVLAVKGGVVPSDLRRRLPRIAEIPFDPAAKMMATQHRSTRGPFVVIKGAPELILELCGTQGESGRETSFDNVARDRIRAAANRMAERALRVLGVAVVDDTEIDGLSFAPFRGRARFLGLVGQIDPPRPEAHAAVARCRQAGIRPVMVTGDHVATALAVAQALGIASKREQAIDGRELDRISNPDLVRRLDTISVFARVRPEQKLGIVELYQERGEVIAMTGDGVNDAPALVKADVGIAMGVTGTDVAKEAADIVITDDNFATIVSAVEEGRVVYRNIKKAILLLFSTSSAEVVVLLLAMVLGYPPPFAAVQILWNNLVTEGLITVNLVLEPPEGDEMKQPPIPKTEPLLTRALLERVGVMVPAITISTVGWFVVRTEMGIPAAQVQTETFTLLAICEWFNVLNCRSETKSALTWSVFRNLWLVGGLVLGNLLQLAVVFWRPLGHVVHTVPISLSDAVALGIAGSLVLWAEEVRKFFIRRRTV